MRDRRLETQPAPTPAQSVTNLAAHKTDSIRTAPAVGSSGVVLLHGGAPCVQGSYLVDPASSHMLVSKIKPCMSKYKLLYTVKLRMAH